MIHESNCMDTCSHSSVCHKVELAPTDPLRTAMPSHSIIMQKETACTQTGRPAAGTNEPQLFPHTSDSSQHLNGR